MEHPQKPPQYSGPPPPQPQPSILVTPPPPGTGHVIVTSQAPLSPNSQPLTCPNCHAAVLTQTKKAPGLLAYLISGFLVLIG